LPCDEEIAMTEQEQRIPKADAPGKGPEGIAPDMQARTVVGVFDRFEQADAALHELQGAGFSDRDISLVMQQSGSAPEMGAGETKADQGTVTGASVGAVLGGVAGLAALAIPGIGPILAAGPIAAAVGALTGGALGGLIGSFGGLGIPTEHAKQYDAAVRAGGVVVAVRVPDRAADDRASQILRQHGARDAASYTQAL
jgi:hypothetical protein